MPLGLYWREGPLAHSLGSLRWCLAGNVGKHGGLPQGKEGRDKGPKRQEQKNCERERALEGPRSTRLPPKVGAIRAGAGDGRRQHDKRGRKRGAAWRFLLLLLNSEGGLFSSFFFFFSSFFFCSACPPFLSFLPPFLYITLSLCTPTSNTLPRQLFTGRRHLTRPRQLHDDSTTTQTIQSAYRPLRKH